MEGFAADTEYWKGNVQGNFTVKSAYVLRCGPTVSDDGKLWQLIHKYRARNLGITRIVLLLDCMEVVRMAKLEYLPPGAPTIMMYLREILSYDWCIEIHHIDRKRNRLAHDLAKLADESSLCPIYFPHPPVSFVLSEYANGIG
ncbi:hypothetical protein V6N11_056665 [Hibiscus sabdariffa]|uniref:RNase H type-1 domain-containing protein n=1 Tax=Hibiscus sabdariffa TaxID=183260 RepID=A0ABR2T4J6_9ROSI